MQSTTAGIEAIGELADFAREKGLVFYDAPVLGTRQPAEAGQLLVLAAGPSDGREAVTPVFDAVGARTVWTGEDGAAGSATRLKLVANSWVLSVTNATGEVLALAQALDVDPQSFFDAIAGGPLDMGYLRAKAGLILDDQLSPAAFAVATAAKDARLIVEAGERHASDSTSPPRAPNASPAPPPRATPTRTWPPRTSRASTRRPRTPRADRGVGRAARVGSGRARLPAPASWRRPRRRRRPGLGGQGGTRLTAAAGLDLGLGDETVTSTAASPVRRTCLDRTR